MLKVKLCFFIVSRYDTDWLQSERMQKCAVQVPSCKPAPDQHQDKVKESIL